MITKSKNLISMSDFSSVELEEILNLSFEVKKDPLKYSNVLKNKNVALIFAKPSLRTRVSFEVGINQLGGHPITIKMDEISIGKREDVSDIGKVLSRYIDLIIIRTFEHKQIEDLAKSSSVPIVNALSDDEHPCQAISDIFTIKETFKDLNNLKLTYIGDGNNMTHSLLVGCAMSNINISIASPQGFEPKEDFIKLARKINSKIKIEVSNNPIEAAKDSHVLYTDVWVSMGQESESNEKKKIFHNYQINDKTLSVSQKNVIVLHCLPAHKGEEITHEIFNKFSETIYRQAENRLHAQKAILIKLSSD